MSALQHYRWKKSRHDSNLTFDSQDRAMVKAVLFFLAQEERKNIPLDETSSTCQAKALHSSPAMTAEMILRSDLEPLLTCTPHPHATCGGVWIALAIDRGDRR